VVILRDEAEGHLLHQMNYIAAQLNVPKWSPNNSTGDVNQMLGSANDYLSYSELPMESSKFIQGMDFLLGFPINKVAQISQ